MPMWGRPPPAVRRAELDGFFISLLAFAGHSEIHAAVLVDLGGCGDVQVRERNLLRPLCREAKQRVADDGVVLYFFFVLITKDQRSGRRGSSEFCVPGLVRSRSRVSVLISTVVIVLPVTIRRARFVRTLLVHHISLGITLVLTIVVRRR